MLLFLAQLADINKLLSQSIRSFIIAGGLFLSVSICCQNREDGWLLPPCHAPS